MDNRDMNESTKIVTLPEPKNLNTHQWTNEEKVFKRKENILREIKDLHIPFQTALFYKLSGSVFGPFLTELNTKQIQDKPLNDNKLQILIWELRRYNEHDLNIINNRNLIFKDYLNLLKKAVNDCVAIDLEFLEAHLNHLSLNCCFMKQVDSSLQNFGNIGVLTLCGNYINNIAGSILPRQLKFLELFDNFISDLTSLERRIPKTLLHLGLGRNRLTNDSNLHLLATSKNLKLLKSLDLSDNDIYDLKLVLNSLEKINSLTTFSLEGNPCSVTPEYKNDILMCFPKLHYLDCTEVLKEDTSNNTKSEKLLPQIIFRCHRILGLPQPPKDVKNTQVFYIEVNFPLLNDTPIDIKQKSVDTLVEEEINTGSAEIVSKRKESKVKKGKEKKEKEKYEKEKLDKNDKKQKKGKKKSYFSGANEYDERFENRNVWFKTERVSWSKIMEFTPICINAPENCLTLIRDTFRSIVPVRLIYLKIAPYSSKPKKQKQKEKSKKDKTSKKAGKIAIDTSIPELENLTEKQHPEIILKKITLGSFYCDLKSVNWSDETLDFYWADHPDIGDKALRVNGSLKVIDYDINTDSRQIKQKLTKNIESNENGVFKKEPVPQVLTCQVGFGLNKY